MPTCICGQLWSSRRTAKPRRAAEKQKNLDRIVFSINRPPLRGWDSRCSNAQKEERKELSVSAESDKQNARARTVLRHPAIICLLLALIPAAVFAQVGGFEFVNYDDPDYVTSNPHIQNGLNPKSVLWAFETGHASNWHPLTWISHIVDWDLFGDKPRGHHLMSVGFHIANTLLVFLLLNGMTGALW